MKNKEYYLKESAHRNIIAKINYYLSNSMNEQVRQKLNNIRLELNIVDKEIYVNEEDIIKYVKAYTDNTMIHVTAPIEFTLGLSFHELGHILYTYFKPNNTIIDNMDRGITDLPEELTTFLDEPKVEKVNKDLAKDFTFADYFYNTWRHFNNIVEDGYLERKLLKTYNTEFAAGLIYVRDYFWDNDIQNISVMQEMVDSGQITKLYAIFGLSLAYGKYGKLKREDNSELSLDIAKTFIKSSKELLTLVKEDDKIKRAGLTTAFLINNYYDIIKEEYENAKKQSSSGNGSKNSSQSSNGSEGQCNTGGSGSMSGSFEGADDVPKGNNPMDDVSNPDNDTKINKSNSGKEDKKDDKDDSDNDIENSKGKEGEESDGGEDNDSSSKSNKKDTSSNNDSKSSDHSDNDNDDSNPIDSDGLDSKMPDEDLFEEAKQSGKPIDIDNSQKGEASYNNDSSNGTYNAGRNQSQLDSFVDEIKALSKALKEEDKRIEEENKYKDDHILNSNKTNYHDEDFEIAVINEEKSAYNNIYSDLEKYITLTNVKLKNFLNQQNQNYKHPYWYGGRLSTRYIHRPDVGNYERKIHNNDKSNLAVFVMIDESGSMGGYNQYLYAAQAAIVIEAITRELDFPCAIYGHTYTNHFKLKKYRDFDDEKSRKNSLANISYHSGNHDGFALRFASDKLKLRKEDEKLLIIISDGQPAAYGYGGQEAIDDMRSIVLDAEKNGITFVAAGIGDSRADVKEIYGHKRFMDVSDVSTLSVKLGNIIKKMAIKR